MSGAFEVVMVALGGTYVLGLTVYETIRAWRLREVDKPHAAAEEALRARFGRLGDGLSLSARSYSVPAPRRRGTRVIIAGVWPELTLSTRQPGRVETGDEQFDGLFDLQGSTALARAVLDAQARGLLAAYARRHPWPDAIRVFGGELCIDVPGRFTTAHLATIEKAVAAAVDVARHLVFSGDIPGRLATNAREDPLPQVRLANLQTLVRDFEGQAATRAAVEAAASDPDGEVRLAAAQMLHGEGHPLLIELATSTKVEDSCSARALDALPALPLEKARGILNAALRPQAVDPAPWRPLTARACVDMLRRGGDAAAVPLLADVLASQKGAIALAAVKALARLGTAAAVLPLQEAAARARDSELAEAARKAAADVQARLLGTPGEVSLAGADAGQVSVAEDMSGRVALDVPARPAGSG